MNKIICDMFINQLSPIWKADVCILILSKEQMCNTSSICVYNMSIANVYLKLNPYLLHDPSYIIWHEVSFISP